MANYCYGQIGCPQVFTSTYVASNCKMKSLKACGLQNASWWVNQNKERLRKITKTHPLRFVKPKLGFTNMVTKIAKNPNPFPPFGTIPLFWETTGHRDATHPGPGDIRWMTSQRQLGYGSSQRERERSRSRKGWGSKSVRFFSHEQICS